MKILQSYKAWANKWSRSQLVLLYVMSIVPTATAVFIYVCFSRAVVDADYWHGQAIMQEIRLRDTQTAVKYWMLKSGATNRFPNPNPTK